MVCMTLCGIYFQIIPLPIKSAGESTALSELPDNADLCFSIDANLATVNDGSPHR